MQQIVRTALWLLIVSLFGGFTAVVQAHPADEYQFSSPEKRQQAVSLAKSLRCPQCQNQSLLESNAVAAQDMLLKVYELVDEGQSDSQVMDYFTERFGDIVRYQPRIAANTLVLWLTPLLLVFGFGWLVFRRPR